MADEELDPLFRGPPPGQEPGDYGPYRSGYRGTSFDVWAAQESANLDVLARARLRQTTGPYAYGRNLYDLAQRDAKKPPGTSITDYTTAADRAAMRRAEISAQLDALGDIEHSDQQLARARSAEIKAAAEASRQRAIQLARQSSLLRSYSGATVAGAGNQLITQYVDLYYRQKRLRERRERILRNKRSGSGATRAPQYTGIPSRTGAKSTRALDPLESRTGSRDSTAKSRQRADSKPVSTTAQLPASTDSVVIGESQASKDARQVMSEVPNLPQKQGEKSAQKTSTAQRSGVLARLTLNLIPAALTGIRTRVQSLAAPRARARARAPAQTSVITPQIPGLTALEAQGVSSAGDPKCKCPKPEKKKRKEFACSNPIISRSVKDGVITIKRTLKCPPSK